MTKQELNDLIEQDEREETFDNFHSTRRLKGAHARRAVGGDSPRRARHQLWTRPPSATKRRTRFWPSSSMWRTFWTIEEGGTIPFGTLSQAIEDEHDFTDRASCRTRRRLSSSRRSAALPAARRGLLVKNIKMGHQIRSRGKILGNVPLQTDKDDLKPRSNATGRCDGLVIPERRRSTRLCTR